MTTLLSPTQLSTLPHEILNRILDYTTDRDLLCMARLNTFYAHLSAPILTHRITRHVQNEGWKLYINVTCEIDTPNGEEHDIVCQERRILGDHVSVDPDTLCVRFVAMPLDEEDKFKAAKSTKGRAITIPNDTPTTTTEEPHILLELYLTKVVNKNLEIAKPISNLTITPPLYGRRATSEIDYRDHANFDSLTPVSITYHVTKSSSDPIETSIDVETIETTAEWWIYQLKNPYNLPEIPVVQNVW